MDPAPDEANPMFVLGIVIIFFKIFAGGPHIHEKDSAIHIVICMLFGNDSLFDGIHAANR